MNYLLEPNYNDRWRRRAIIVMYRTQNATAAYHDARSKTLQTFEKSTVGRPATRLYFAALAAWEAVILNVGLAFEVAKGFDGVSFGEDGERLIKMANRIKHVGEDISKGQHSNDLTVAVWMTVEGVVSRVTKLSYAELAENVEALASFADWLQNPMSES